MMITVSNPIKKPCDFPIFSIFFLSDLDVRASKLQNISNIPVNCCIECGLFPRSLMESTIAGAGFAGERRTLGSDDDYCLKTSTSDFTIF